jgi:hypothetical protein
MINILIIPPDNTDYVDSVIELAKDVKQSLPEASISTLVTSETYDHYYYSGYFEGLIIDPGIAFRRLYLFEFNQFDVVLQAQQKLIWALACFRAYIRKKISLGADFSEAKKKQQILSQLLKINAENN